MTKTKKILNNKLFIFIAFILIFSAIFSVGIHGIGGYWDWTFPYTLSGLKNIYGYQSDAWILADLGGPLKYSPDLYLRLFLSSLSFIGIQPEIILYLLLVFLFSGGAFGVWLIIRKQNYPIISFLLALVVFINPLMFYKLLAGHINYYFAIVIMVYMILFLSKNKITNLRAAIILGLFLGFVGCQIQFFFFSSSFVSIYFLFNKNKIFLRYIPIILGVVLIINSPWLINFLFGAVSADGVSNSAKAGLNILSSQSNLVNEYNLSFTSSTHIAQVYPKIALSFFVLIWCIIFLNFVRNKYRSKDQVMYLCVLITLIFIATGIYQSVSFGPVQFIAPMFREVGHFGPLMILYMILLIGSSKKFDFNKIHKTVILTILIAFLSVNSYIFYKYIPTINYASLRKEYSNYNFNLNNNNNKYIYRSLSYPFFGQYSYYDVQNKSKDGFLLNNVGYDNYVKFLGENFLENAQRSNVVRSSPQYQLLINYNLDVLKPYGVKYIYDFSKIYESNYDKYVNKDIYNGNSSFIKNDPNFFNKLIEKNPGKIKKIASGVYEILNYIPITNTNTNLALIDDQDSTGETNNFLESIYGENYSTTTSNKQLITSAYVNHLFNRSLDNTDPASFNEMRNTQDSINKSKTSDVKRIYSNSDYRGIEYKKVADTIYLRSSEPDNLTINNNPVSFGSDKTFLDQLKIDPYGKYVIQDSVNGLSAVIDDQSWHNIGVFHTGDQLKVYSVEKNNLINNGDFRNGPWQSQVNDCSNYDKNPNISMAIIHQGDNNYLSLNASKHTACTFQQLKTEANTDYILSFNYFSDTSQSIDYGLQYNNGKLDVYRTPVSDSGLHTKTDLIFNGSIPNPRLYLYSREQNAIGNNVVNYTNFEYNKVLTSYSVNLDFGKQHYSYVDVAKTPDLVFKKNIDMSTRNIISSTNFERGLWSTKVDDCNNYDNKPDISMSFLKNMGYKSSNALLLTAKHHDACTSTTANVDSANQYTLTFNYRSNQQAAYVSLSYNDKQKTIDTKELRNIQPQWQSYSTTIKVPVGATEVNVKFISKEVLKSETNNLFISDVGLTMYKPIDNEFFATNNYNVNKSTSATKIENANNTNRIFHLKGVKNVTNVVLNENYNKNWELLINNTKVSSIHYIANGYANGWQLDINAVCKNNQICTLNSDGSYDLSVKLSFKTGYLFKFVLYLSRIIVVILIIYIFMPYPLRLIQKK